MRCRRRPRLPPLRKEPSTNYSNHGPLDLLSWRRPAGSRTERRFLREFLPAGAVMDTHRNYHITVGDSSMLWSCHTDSVHRMGGKQRVATVAGMAFLADEERQSNCLGADDAIGVWLMLEMIGAGVEGRYIFHYGEERGGIGSTALTRDAGWQATLRQYRACIAFDRMGYGDVITHQGFGRCCSAAFAESLSGILNAGDAGFVYRPCAEGIYTDSAEYTDLIGECTNLSVGYVHQHSRCETADIDFAYRLRDVLVEADFSGLAIVRAPGEYEPYDWGGDWGVHGNYSSYPVKVKEEDIVWSRGYNWDDDPLSPEAEDMDRLKKRLLLDKEYCYYCDNGGCLYCQ